MSLFPEHIIPSAERLAAHEVNYTPYGVVKQGLAQFKARYEGLQIKRFLDPSAGQGVYCRVVRELWPDCHITAVEIRHEERAALEEVADEVRIEPFDPEACAPGSFDLIAGNPPFSFTRKWVEALQRRRVAHHLLILDKTQAFQRSKEGVEMIRRCPPIEEYRVAQSVKFRAKGSGDSVCYSHWLFDLWRGSHDASWKSFQLKCLDSSERRH